jgi:hypothetical protein
VGSGAKLRASPPSGPTGVHDADCAKAGWLGERASRRKEEERIRQMYEVIVFYVGVPEISDKLFADYPDSTVRL